MDLHVFYKTSINKHKSEISTVNVCGLMHRLLQAPMGGSRLRPLVSIPKRSPPFVSHQKTSESKLTIVFFVVRIRE